MAKYSTAKDQLFFAKYEGTEDALQSVARYYPTAEYEVQQAKQELALLYLVQNREEEAAHLFDGFAHSDDTEPESRAFGLVGQAFLEAHKGRHEQSVKTIAEASQILKSIHRERLHPEVLRLLEETAAANDRALKQRTKENVQQLIDKLKLESSEGTGQAVPVRNQKLAGVPPRLRFFSSHPPG